MSCQHCQGYLCECPICADTLDEICPVCMGSGECGIYPDGSPANVDPGTLIILPDGSEYVVEKGRCEICSGEGYLLIN